MAQTTGPNGWDPLRTDEDDAREDQTTVTLTEPSGGRPHHHPHVLACSATVLVALAIALKALFIFSFVGSLLDAAKAGVFTSVMVYGVVTAVLGFFMRWTSWGLGLSHVLRPDLYEGVGYWLVRVGLAVGCLGAVGVMFLRYVG